MKINNEILCRKIIGITDLKKDPCGVFNNFGSEELCVLNRNKPVLYVVSPNKYKEILDYSKK